ncbi:hypothetical protein Clacol_003276 [Clathrus columnatus]|uniref:beta-galactosidase n=1 Tax=Clathrus columnatus TaxID=1419009 RepID=A0AAV5A8I9_9AGAM|nr:hypothetical protein Clacol_003276 [Clathrus columnatus]
MASINQKSLMGLTVKYKAEAQSFDEENLKVHRRVSMTKRFSWTLSAVLSLGLVLLTWPVTLRGASSSIPSRGVQADPPRQSNNLTDVVHSGEFHAFRIPVPDLWLDIFQKIKAAGLNAVRLVYSSLRRDNILTLYSSIADTSTFSSGGLSNPSRDVLDFDDWRNLQTLFDAAKAAGLFIVLRPGPYINAETTAGGIAHWVTSEVAGDLRTNATDFEISWTPYIQAIIDAVVPNQVTNGGPIIDNEYSQSPISHAVYFAQLEAAYRDGGVVVPLTYNDPGMGLNFINGTGAVDVYGLDSYPQGFDCSDPETWAPVTLNYHQYHEEANPSQPFYMPEFQGGSFDPWGGPGYDACESLTGPDFMDVFYKENWASNVKLISFYMLYGGTSWANLPYPGVYTSYDYGASIRENRVLSDKFDELKRQGLFLRSSPELRKTDWIGDTSTGAVSVNGSAAFVTLLHNPGTNTGFYIARQHDSTSTASTDFSLSVDTSKGVLSVPRTFSSINLNGRQSKVIVTDYTFGGSQLLYSTASVLFAGKIGNRDVLYLFGDSNQYHEAAFEISLTNSLLKSSSPSISISSDSTNAIDTVTFLPGINGLVTIFETESLLVLFSDPITAATFWAPVVPGNSPLTNYWQFGSNETVLVGGPYLVRNVTIEGNELKLTGDLNRSTILTVFAPDNVRTVSWNGLPVDELKQAQGSSSALTGQLTMESLSSLQAPQLTNWKFADSLPEIKSDFSDKNWVTANHTKTNIIVPPQFGDGRVLYGCDYGFCEGAVLWRGHFIGTGQEKSVNLSIAGGTAFAASVWINDVFIKSTPGDNSTPSSTDEVFEFPSGSVKVGKDNVITVVQDNTGLDESGSTTNDPKSPRGIQGFQLDVGNITTWKVQGKLGGYTNYPDKTRGIFNEGGLFGERAGWHLPGFDTSSWTSRSLSEGLPNNNAGIGFFVTTFDLHVPGGTDIPMSFVFEDNSERYRALLFVNGWNYGKRVGNLGPQTKFPVHQGLLEYNGKNVLFSDMIMCSTVAVALWSLDANSTVTPKLSLVIDGQISGGVGPIAVNNPSWSPRHVV